MRLRNGTALALAGVLAVSTGMAAGTGQARAEPATKTERPRISWGSCPELPERYERMPERESLECGTLTVPVDYREPNGETIDIAVSRLASTDRSKRRGALLLNPGGPGLPGLDTPLFVGSQGDARLAEGYDLIGFDPRGVGRSAGVTCGLDGAGATQLSPTQPVGGPKGARARIEQTRELVAQCEEHDPEGLWPHLSTNNTLRDMDRIRRALGEEKVSYLGWSYGTYLGAAYSQQYPEHSDKVVLDGVVDPKLSWREVYRNFGEGGERSLTHFTSWAARHDDVYHLGDTPAEVRKTFHRLADRLDRKPIPGVDGTAFRWITFFNFYDTDTYPVVAELWRSVGKGEPPAGAPEPPPAGIPADNFQAALTAVTCADMRWTETVSDYERAIREDDRRYPAFGAMMANAWACAGSDAEPVEPRVTITGKGPSNVLLLQNTKDPATVYGGAVSMRNVLGGRARLVTVDEAGHGVYVHQQNGCASDLATEFLLGADLPERDRFCAAETPLPQPTAKP